MTNNTNAICETNNIFQNNFKDLLDTTKIIKKNIVTDNNISIDNIIIDNEVNDVDIKQNNVGDEDEKTEIVKRRRGRPRKSFNYNILPKKEKKKNINFFNKESNDIILHLSLKPSDVGLIDNNIMDNDDILFMNRSIKNNLSIEPNKKIDDLDMSIFKKISGKQEINKKNIKIDGEYCSENIELSDCDENSSSYDITTSEFYVNNSIENSFQQSEKNTKKLQHCINERIINHDDNFFMLNSNNSTKNSELKNDETCDYIDHIKKEIKEKNKIIKQLRDELMNYKQYVTKNETNILEINLNLIDLSSGTPIIVNKTDIACWWCTYNFESTPYFLPDKYYNDAYHVFGCFCSVNCACSYNVNMNDSKIWERYSLLKNMYSEILNNNINISLAAPKEILQKYGGSVSIEDYRKSLDTNLKIYRHIIPPLAPIISYIEEKNKCENGNKINEIKIKRSKPLPNVKNILENYETIPY